MKLIPYAVSTFNINSFTKVLNQGELHSLDISPNKFEALEKILDIDWTLHTHASFYFDMPDEAIDILNNACLFNVQHHRGIGILSGTISAFQSFIESKSIVTASKEERYLANLFYNMLKAQFGMFKEYIIKPLADKTFTMEK